MPAGELLSADGRLVLDLLWWTPGEVEQARSPEGLRRTRTVASTKDGPLVVEERWTEAARPRAVRAWYRYLPPRGEPVTASFRGRRWTPAELRRRLERAGMEIVRLRGGYDDRPFDPTDARTLLVEARRRGAEGGGMRPGNPGRRGETADGRTHRRRTT